MVVTVQVDSYARLNVPIALWENILELYVQRIRFLIVFDFQAFHPFGAFDLVTADMITIVFPSWTHVTLKKMLPNYFHKLVLSSGLGLGSQIPSYSFGRHSLPNFSNAYDFARVL